MKERPAAPAGNDVETAVIEHTAGDGTVYYVEHFQKTILPADIDSHAANILGCEACPQHGRNLACPPFSPPFPRHIGLKTSARVTGYRVSLEQFPGQTQEERYHAAFREMRGLLVQELLEERRRGRVVAGAGACLACEECAAAQGEKKCRNPAAMIYSLESMGVNLVALSEKALDLRLQWSGSGGMADHVIAIGAVFYD